MALPARAADLKLEAQLILGVNEDPNAAKYQPVTSELCGKLHRMFKWKNYFDVTNRTASLALNQSCDLKMNDACAIRVKNLGGSRLEVNCIGHGKEVHKGTYALEPPQWLVLGGNGSNNTAWFVGLRAIDGKTADAQKAISKN